MKRLEIAAVIILKLAALCCAAYGELPPGTVLVSRNLDEEDNTTLGHWNHLAIVATDGSIIESQIGKGVQKVTLAEYQSRPYSPPLALVPCAPEVGQRAAAKAESLVGLPYRPYSSIFRRQGELRQKLGFNCVSPVKAAYWQDDRRIRRLKTPDGVLKLEGLFDAPRPLSEVLKQPAAPAVPPTEHSVLVTPKTYKHWDGTRIVDIGHGCYLTQDYQRDGKHLDYGNWLKPFNWARYEWRDVGEQ
jgi:hypothetical protein